MPLFRRSCLFVLAAVLLLAHAPSASAWNADPAQPGEVFFFPEEALLTVEERLKPEALPGGGAGFLLALPKSVDVSSFVLSIGGLSAGGYYWLEEDEQRALLAEKRGLPPLAGAELPENETLPERRALLESVVTATLELARLRGESEAIATRKQLLRKTYDLFGTATGGNDAPAPSLADEAGKLDENFARLYPQLNAEAQQNTLAITDAQERLTAVWKKLRDFDNNAERMLLAVPFDGPATEEQVLRYSYAVPASCGLSYRLDARPDSGELSIAQDATLTQHSGFAWDDAELFISTIRRDRTLQPTPVRPWTIVLADKAPPAPEPRAEVMMKDSLPAGTLAQMATADTASRARNQTFSPAPVQEERSSFRLWSLGKKRIGDKNPARLALATDSYKADFLYTLRPASNPKGFLTADLALPKALELPPGPASFAVDGAVIGSQMFSFNGDKGTIFFGSDPQVTAVMRDLKRSGGEEGFFSKEQTLLWHWLITLKSTRPKAVNVVLEDPAPVSRNSAVAIKVSSTPKAEETVNPPERGGAKMLFWKFTLQPGEAVEVKHKVEASAPVDKSKELRPGR